MTDMFLYLYCRYIRPQWLQNHSHNSKVVYGLNFVAMRQMQEVHVIALRCSTAIPAIAHQNAHLTTSPGLPRARAHKNAVNCVLRAAERELLI